MVKLNPTVKFVTDEALEALAKKPRTIPKGEPPAVINLRCGSFIPLQPRRKRRP